MMSWTKSPPFLTKRAVGIGDLVENASVRVEQLEKAFLAGNLLH